MPHTPQNLTRSRNANSGSKTLSESIDKYLSKDQIMIYAFHLIFCKIASNCSCEKKDCKYNNNFWIFGGY